MSAFGPGAIKCEVCKGIEIYDERPADWKCPHCDFRNSQEGWNKYRRVLERLDGMERGVACRYVTQVLKYIMDHLNDWDVK